MNAHLHAYKINTDRFFSLYVTTSCQRKKDMRIHQILIVSIAVTTLFLTCTAVTSFAGGGPSVDKCEDISHIDCMCYSCSSGKYIGKVSIASEYDPEYGDCMKRFNDALNLCSKAYDLGDDRAAYCSHKTGLKTYYAWAPTSCNVNWPKGKSAGSVGNPRP